MIVPHKVKLLKRYWRLLLIVITPIILLPLPLIRKTIQVQCGYIVLILTIYWIFEPIPYAVTSLLPLVFFPMAGILSGEDVGGNYFEDISTMFLGSMILACAIEHVQLHRRIALFVLRYVGSSVIWSMAGLMGVTAFLSMWINNSASANIMIPTAVAIVDELQNHQQTATEDNQENDTDQNKDDSSSTDGTTTSENKTPSDEQKSAVQNIVLVWDVPKHEDSSSKPDAQDSSDTPSDNQIDYNRLKSGYLIAVAYSAGIGGMITLVGTGPNIFVKGFADQYYSSGSNTLKISFANFLTFGLPIGIVLLIFCWLWLQVLYNRKGLYPCKRCHKNDKKRQGKVDAMLKKQYEELGSLSWQEGTIAILFVIVVILWVTRDFGSSRGWDIIFREDYVTDGTTAILIGCLPLILPNKNLFKHDWKYHPILTWDEMAKAFPWGVFMLQGAGLVLADGFKASNLSDTVANFLQFIVRAPETVIILIVIIVSAIFTEFTSNLACASILFPILDSIGKTAGIHPGRLILPSCMAVSLSFMLAISSPPNAMIVANKSTKAKDLLIAGFGVKIIGIIIVFFGSLLLISPIFHIQGTISPSSNTSMGNVTNG